MTDRSLDHTPDHAPDRSTVPVRTIRVELGARSYDVLIGPGLLASAGAAMTERFGPNRVAIVTDENVRDAGHLSHLERALGRHCKLLGSVVVPPGEATKCFDALVALTGRLLELGVERTDLLVALGGGVIGDLAGFASSILRRGVRFVQIPTTLLAQVDSSVGGKTGINTAHGKNLIGAFHQPSLVLADTATLATLPDRQMRAGYAEVAKHGLLADAEYFSWLEGHGTAVLAHDPAALVEAVARSVAIKASVVTRDETEADERMLLNLGHTFGHALEAWAGFSDRVLHGEAVAVGTAMAYRFSERQALCPAGTALQVAAHFNAVGLPTRSGHLFGPDHPQPVTLMQLMAQDKKVRQGRLTLILARNIGQAFIAHDVASEDVEQFLSDELAQPAV